jgi:hypothetical protein
VTLYWDWWGVNSGYNAGLLVWAPFLEKQTHFSATQMFSIWHQTVGTTNHRNISGVFQTTINKKKGAFTLSLAAFWTSGMQDISEPHSVSLLRRLGRTYKHRIKDNSIELNLCETSPRLIFTVMISRRDE